MFISHERKRNTTYARYEIIMLEHYYPSTNRQKKRNYVYDEYL